MYEVVKQKTLKHFEPYTPVADGNSLPAYGAICSAVGWANEIALNLAVAQNRNGLRALTS